MTLLRSSFLVSLTLVVVAGPTVSCSAAPVAEPAQNVARWLNWLIPLPKEVTIPQQVTVPAADVKITLANCDSALAQNAERKLRGLFLEKAGSAADSGDGFEILLGLCDSQGRIGQTSVADAARLGELPNSEQAYLIRPDGANRLVLAARDPKGLFYAALTLRQLLESKFHGDDVTLPLAVVTDWPDMSERGEWGGSSVNDIEWMANRKMNLVEFHTTHKVGEKGNPVTVISRSLLRRGQVNAVKMVPIISHLNSMGSRGIYQAYPELKGKGDTALYKSESTELWAPCASNPKLYEIMAGWMRGYAAYGVSDISCWLGELTQHCDCEECSKTGQFALETRAFVKAWQIARQDYPDLRIRILTTQGSYTTNDRVLAEVPPEVGVTYYDGGRTYDSSREAMIYPLLEQYAAEGHWLGCYPQLTPSWRIVSPWSCPQFVKARMVEFVDKGLASLGGYVVPDNRLFDFNVTAAAEWSWNAHGRDERQFALAWATRHGFVQPEAVADWAVLIGPVSWDIYGARLVERYFFRPITIERMVKSRAVPAFGQGMFRYIPDAEHLARNLAICRQAMNLAQRSGSSAVKAETQVVTTYYEMLDQLCRITGFLAQEKEKMLDVAGRQSLQTHMNAFTLASVLNTEALGDWERAVAVGTGSSRFREGVQATQDTVNAVAGALVPLGIRNPANLLVTCKIGGWSSEDFQEQATVEKTIDVTEQLASPGTYRVTLQYSRGWNGAATHRAALVAQPRDGSGKPVEVCVDEHEGSTAHRSENNVYMLRLVSYDPSLRYQLVVRIRGTRPRDQQPGRTGCSGDIILQRERDPDWQLQIMEVKPSE